MQDQPAATSDIYQDETYQDETVHIYQNETGRNKILRNHQSISNLSNQSQQKAAGLSHLFKSLAASSLFFIL